jgi:hypothetical protein
MPHDGALTYGLINSGGDSLRALEGVARPGKRRSACKNDGGSILLLEQNSFGTRARSIIALG